VTIAQRGIRLSQALKLSTEAAMPVCASERTRLVLTKIMNAAGLDVRRILCAPTPMSAVPARMPMDELEPDDEQDDD
jgi:hypothetical protein